MKQKETKLAPGTVLIMVACTEFLITNTGTVHYIELYCIINIV